MNSFLKSIVIQIICTLIGGATVIAALKVSPTLRAKIMNGNSDGNCR